MSARHASRPGTLWLQILLIGGLACAVIILVQTFRLQRSNRTVVEHALHDYADFAAWSYAQHLSMTMREAVDELLGAVNHGEGLHTSPRIPDAQEMGHFLPEDHACQAAVDHECHRLEHGPFPVRFLGFTLGSDTMGVGVNMAKPPVMGWLAGPTDGPPVRAVPVNLRQPDDLAWLNSLLTEVARGPKSDWGYRVLVERTGGQPRFIGARNMPTIRGDTVVYAFEYSGAAMDSIFHAVLTSGDLLPESIAGGRPNSDMLDLEVLDARGLPLFRSGPDGPWDLDATAILPASYGGLRVHARIRGGMAEDILIGGSPESRVPILLVILALALGLTALAAVQLRREVRFAAERANFVANVSHELRTPLSQIRLVLDTIRLGRAGDRESHDHALQVADREALRLQHLVEGVLTFTRGSGDGQPRVPLDAVAEARSVIAEWEQLAQPHHVTLSLTAPDALPVSLRRTALRQVLLNLLDNAVKYGGDGTAIGVHLERLLDGGVRLRVDDNGPGVPPSERDRIWRPFERGDVARTRAAGGSGIGLTIVQDIARQHGGKATVTDAPGGGARFVVDFREADA